ncbi:hypothetical protein POTOM_032069 [Populus tomentosa]|uniref:Pre-mRNA-processing factor 19 n=1 Tax=Populus tomentosa TaxID=118781 RepID=A0A8X7Z5A4_POPTO|nr:hypothetical protein POTOM_032069 [Populus tomentosa]
MHCSISGEVPEQPVVSKKSGLLYEKRLIERHISEYGKCPITGEPLTMDDIVPVKTGKIVKPRTVQTASIPGMLGMFQNEWDGLMLSNFALEQQLHTARQELSHALYQNGLFILPNLKLAPFCKGFGTIESAAPPTFCKMLSFKTLEVKWLNPKVYTLVLHDAACRVIARLKKERDEARSLLAQAERQIPMSASEAVTENASVLSNGKRAAEDDDLGQPGKRARPGISASIITELTDCNATLSQQRKKRQIPPTLAPIGALERYTQLSSHPLHKTSKPGILSIDIQYSKDIIATGGVDATAVVFDRLSGQIVSTLSGHSKKVTSVKFVAEGEFFLTGSADKVVDVEAIAGVELDLLQIRLLASWSWILFSKGLNHEIMSIAIFKLVLCGAVTVRVWQGSEDGNYDCRHILKDHTSEVQAVTVHATNNYFVTASLDNTWCFYDLSSGLCMTQVADTSKTDGYTSAAFHPDGLILGTGTSEAVVKIWDVKSQANVAKFEGHVGPVTAISFSENGYFLATAAHDSVKLWDLRKLKNFRTLNLYDSDTPTNSVEFDHSGSYLGIAGSDIRVYQVGSVKADWNCIKTLPDLSGTGRATCLKFGPDANYIAVGSMDRNLRVFGLPGDEAPLES